MDKELEKKLDEIVKEITKKADELSNLFKEKVVPLLQEISEHTGGYTE